MSKKQAVINKFFQPKTKDYELSSEPLRVKPRILLKTRDKNANRSPVIISLLSSSDEDDEIVTDCSEKTNKTDSVEIECESNNGDPKQVSALSDIPVNDTSNNSTATTDFPDVVRQEENDSLDTKENRSQELADYKLSNFSSMVDWILNDQSNYHLFDENDWTVIENFKSTSGRR